MLFFKLHAILFFLYVLGTSVMAFPIFPASPQLSPRGASKEPRVMKEMDGYWICEKYRVVVYVQSQAVTKAFPEWDQQSRKERVHMLFTQWKRATKANTKGLLSEDIEQGVPDNANGDTFTIDDAKSGKLGVRFEANGKTWENLEMPIRFGH